MVVYSKFEYDSYKCVNDLQLWEMRAKSRGTLQSGYPVSYMLTNHRAGGTCEVYSMNCNMRLDYTSEEHQYWGRLYLRYYRGDWFSTPLPSRVKTFQCPTSYQSVLGH